MDRGARARRSGFVPAQAAENVFIKNGAAVSGYDVIAYFDEGKPRKGTAEFQSTYKGAVYRFSSEENLSKFAANPSAYAPQYGGHCAWAAANNYLADGNPNYWRIVDGKLYLNYNGSVQRKWEKDIPGFITKADANWPGLK